MLIDNLQYANWSRRIFQQMRDGGVDAVHVTVAYHEDFKACIDQLALWNRRFEDHGDLIMRATSASDVRAARASGRTAIVLGSQTPTPIGDDIGLIEILHQLGLRFMQLSYDNQSLLASGCREEEDTGLTRFGHQAVREMNRVGLVIDMSHSGERSTLETIEHSQRPIAITHANPAGWYPARRNVSDAVLDALMASGGMLGLSLHPRHLKGEADCTLDSFCGMVVDLVDRYGARQIGLGSALCQGQPDSVAGWMRNGKWTKRAEDAGNDEGPPAFPKMPTWFWDNRDFTGIQDGLVGAGLDRAAIDGIMGENWLRFYGSNFGPT
ncbi:membrane dipeptidase [Salipiger sp. IMCC34102]|uniref:membrane dipeptidase n=1 Tax=Salipiger sp. IMCC34102 TaxID=2510647 RepID=UPI00101C258E|nr:membrane dipeptidase [Salipiger sp. IMCC34102]RYH02177.1 membrane dipeptidase [Salipiger sp. IMCC34102]